VIIGEFNVVGVGIAPSEADSPLIVNPDAVFSLSISGQLFKTVPRREAQIDQIFRGVQHNEFPLGEPLHVLVELSHADAIEDSFGVLVAKRPDHVDTITRPVMIVKRY
jgi:hypothetical protein